MRIVLLLLLLLQNSEIGLLECAISHIITEFFSFVLVITRCGDGGIDGFMFFLAELNCEFIY